MKKKVRELTYDDLGKNVVVSEPNGDRNSGQLTTIHYDAHSGYGILSVDNSTVRADVDSDVEFTD